MNHEINTYVIVNPGSHPAPRWIAVALSDQGDLDSYWTSAQAPGRWALLGVKRARLGRLLGSRILPIALPEKVVRRRGVVADLAAALTLSVRPALRQRAILRRNQILARAVKAHLAALQDRGLHPLVVIPTDTRTEVERFCRERSVPYVLYTPMPHAAFSESLLREAMEMRPKWKEYLGSRSVSAQEVDESDADAIEARMVLANSRFSADSYRALRGSGVHSVPLALDLAKVRRSSGGTLTPAATRHTGSRLRVAYAGQMNQRKGLGYVFEAISGSRLADTVQLNLYGSDSLQFVRTLHQEFPDVDFVHHGRLSQDALWEQLALNHVFVFPTLLDGFGSVIAEAASLSLPLVVTDRCGASDLNLVGAGAIEVPAHSSAAIRDALLALEADETLRLNMAHEAQRAMNAAWTWADYGRTVGGLLMEGSEPS